MPNTIKLRRSATQGAVPTTSQILLGELAVNTYDGLVHLKRSTSGNETGAGTSIVSLATGGAVTSSNLTMTTARLLGRTTASTGAVEEISVSGGLTLSASSLSAPSLSSTTPAALGTAAVGTGTTTARADHVHAMPSASDVSALPLTFSANTITYGATVDLDMASRNGGYFTISLTGNLTFTTSNRAAGRTVTLRLICDGTQRTLTVPAGWVFVGSKPANIAASKTGIFSLSFFGTADSDCIAAYGVQA